jgi:hypothetical protein
MPWRAILGMTVWCTRAEGYCFLTVEINVAGYAVAVPCIDFNDPIIANIPPQYLEPPDICACNDEACILAPPTISAAKKWGENLFGGNLLVGFNEEGIARFTDLNTKLARSDLRLSCRFASLDEELADSPAAQNDILLAFVLTNVYTTTEAFSVIPGRLATLIPLSSPADVPSPNCTRCPVGIHFPTRPLTAVVQLLDSNHNELALCTSASYFCAGAPDALLYVALYVGATKVSDIPLGNLHGSTEMNAELGKAFFDDIRIAKSNAGYRLQFLAQAYDFQRYGSDLASKRIIRAESEEFIIVNGAPSTIELRVRNQNYTLKHIHWRSSDRAQN